MSGVASGGTRATILEAATRLFGSQGYAGTTMRDIAKEVGVLPGSLYSHIDGKESLLFEIVEDGINRFLALGDVENDGETSTQRLHRLITDHVSVIGQDPDRTLVVFHQWRYLTGDRLEIAVEKRRRYEDLITRIVEAGLASGEFDGRLSTKVTVKSLLGSLNWTAEWYRPDGPESPAQIGEHLSEAIVFGLRNR
jgi:TetR/AcrR family transcriptional regulator, cholesterol catabolism regulator